MGGQDTAADALGVPPGIAAGPVWTTGPGRKGVKHRETPLALPVGLAIRLPAAVRTADAAFPLQRPPVLDIVLCRAHLVWDPGILPEKHRLPYHLFPIL